MSLPSQNQTTSGGKVRRANRRRGDGEVRDAQHDVDVVRMVATEVDQRTAAAQHEMIAQAAYYRAERRGFATGHELDDWLAAEMEIAQGSH